MGRVGLVWQFQTVGLKSLQLMVSPPLRGAPYPRVLLALELPPQRFRQRGGGNTEGAAPPAPLGAPRALPAACSCHSTAGEAENCRAEESGDSVEGENRCWARQPVFSTIPALALFVENCLGAGTHLYTLNFFSSDQHSTRFPSEHFRAWG